MTNDVDTSTETINAEFDAAEQVIGITPDDEHTQPVIDPMIEAERDAHIAIAKEMFATTLRLGISMMGNITLDNRHYDEAAQAYAVVIIKYFPGGLFSLLDKYKEELAAGTATFMLISAINQAKAKQQQDEDDKAKAGANATTAPDSSPSSSFHFSEEAQGGTNG